jgi:hypothetical protein
MKAGMEPIELDGALGEGGGQVLRTALTLSMITGTPFCYVPPYFRLPVPIHSRLKRGVCPALGEA